jgi:hypothetical protein
MSGRETDALIVTASMAAVTLEAFTIKCILLRECMAILSTFFASPTRTIIGTGSTPLTSTAGLRPPVKERTRCARKLESDSSEMAMSR